MTSQKLIDKWIHIGENEQLDFKHQITSCSKIAKTLVAFANCRGGKVVVGVEDNGDILGCDIEGEKYQISTAAKKFCSPVLPVEYETLNYKGAFILIASIAESSIKPVLAIDKKNNQKVYIRLRDQCVVPAPEILESLNNGDLNQSIRTPIYKNEVQSIKAMISKSNGITLKQYADIKSISLHNAKRVLFNMLLDGHFTMNSNNVFLNI